MGKQQMQIKFDRKMSCNKTLRAYYNIADDRNMKLK